ncbi:MAG TPA: S9 family peptidase [Candidatus Polarisedimenticolaceae bacterium]|nr:S9 family peptidase [Candidatus Polarisedimenticolaceae bacterium]
MRSVRGAAWILASFLLSAGARAATPHPFAVRDMVAMERLSDPQLSPDGHTVAFVLRTIDVESFKSNYDLWLVGSDGQNLRRLTTDVAADNNPRWLPDGRSLLFLSTRSGNGQVWRIAIDGGEAQPVTTLPLEVNAFALSPDGKRLALALDAFPTCDSAECTQKRLDELKEKKSTGRIYDKLFIRHWDTWKDGRRSHLFVSDVAGGKAVDVMRGMDVDAPSKPFGGTEEFCFTPDSRSLVFTARDAGREEAWSTDFDLYVVPADGSTPPRNLTDDNPAWDTQPAFSPDGKTLAYLAHTRAGFESDRFRIVLRSWPDGAPRVLSEAWDRSPGGIAWSEDGKTIYAHADDVGQHALFGVDASSGKMRSIVAQGNVDSIAVGGGRIVYALDHLRSPVELYSARPDGGDVRTLTRINAERLAAAQLGEPEQFNFKGWNDETVWGYVVKPAAFDPNKKYPVAFLIHGGPQGSFNNHFHYRWNPQAYAGAGYAVVMVDFHGSTGYGQAFTDAIRGDWGGKPLEDLQKGLAAALARYPWMDGERVGALGASFGGYMVDWIAGAWPDRFKCLVSHDGNIDERMAYYDTEELWFPEWEHHGTPWDNPGDYTKHNPIDLIGKWKTPMLVIHSANDFRVVDTQGLGAFTALQRRGIPSQLLYFPDENHWVLKPANSILWHETVLGWLDRWLK